MKKSIDKVISNKKIDELYDFAIKNGATGGKILGAGGGGFMLLYSPKDKISKLKEVLKILLLYLLNSLTQDQKYY